MRDLLRFLARSSLMRCSRGATAVEYGLVVALIVLAMLAALNKLASKTVGMWNNVATEVSSH
ncbi:Flp family type IVb pilin [Sphingobium sp. CCH11-B1]|uniref:Flp family type IVb pilin n=1 Tax=Sphingobium sp. CCH11-B1 TaxID=1768781 RepID=UPI0008347D73|nr:Flp family type IVb pilin [Sphingobium sp. CCH11-B1]MEA3389684.1 Flp family type IVb pilin [Pseudomonadota bacterium]